MSLFAELTNSVNAVRPGRTKMRSYDLPLLVASFTLVAIGLLMVYSASIALADGPRYANYGRYYFVVRHGLFVAVGLLISSLVLTVPVLVPQRWVAWNHAEDVATVAQAAAQEIAAAGPTRTPAETLQ